MGLLKLKLREIIRLLKNKLALPVVGNILTVGLITLLIKGLGFYKELIIAENFGLSELLDTFLIAMLIPGFISTVFLGSYSNVFIPNYIKEIKQDGNIKAFQTTSLLITLGIAIVFIIIAYLFTDVYLQVVFDGHTEQYYNLIKTQLYYLLPCIILWSLSSLMIGILNVNNEFFYSSLGGVFMSLGIICSLVFFKDILQEKVLAVGVLGGSVVGICYTLIIALNKKVIHLGRPDFVNENIIILIKQIPAKVSSALINAVNPIVDQFFSAQLVIGSIAALNYGLKIPMFVIGLIGIALGNVLLPYFSNFAAEDIGNALLKLRKILKYNLILCIMIAAILFLSSEFLVALIYERKAFTAEDTQVVFRVQEMYILMIPFYVSGLIMNRFLTAINKNNFLVVTSTVSLLLNIILNYILIEQMGVFGLALATSLVSMTNTIIIYSYIVRLKK